MNDAKPQKIVVTPEMAITAMTSILSYMREAGAVVAHRDRDGELFLRIRFNELDIVPVTKDVGAVYFQLAPRVVDTMPAVAVVPKV